MSRKPDKCGRCLKIGYVKESQAHAYAIEHELEYGKICRVYKCPFCPNFLITTRPDFRKHD